MPFVENIISNQKSTLILAFSGALCTFYLKYRELIFALHSIYESALFFHLYSCENSVLEMTMKECKYEKDSLNVIIYHVLYQ